MKDCRILAVLLLTTIAAAQERPATPVSSPQQHIGRPLGADFHLVDWDECSAYFRKLAEQSPNVRLTVAGKTTEGRDMLVAAISSQSNLNNLERLKAFARTIADPRETTREQRDAAVREGKVFLTITPGMHSTEVGGTQFGMQFAYQLATSDAEPWKSARENAVVVLLPSLNPDGLDHVCEWYRKTVGTPHETTAMLKLYQLYTGHDNNRDYFMLSQAETKILSRLLYYDWRPQIHWDVHQQGNSGERMFVPPFRDPLNPNLDAAIVAGVNLIGMRAQLDMTREGLTGVASGVKYENWVGVGNRGAPARHNMVAILTELASANIASPVFQKRADLKPVFGQTHGPSNQHVSPWPGGWWRIGDIIKYELAFGRSLLGTINREPRLWLSNALEANMRAIESGRSEGVRAWVIPADERDRAAVTRLIDALIGTGIEVHVSASELTLDGRTYPAGSILIRRDQPWAAHVKDVFEVQRYPKGYEPYDVAGWTLPLLMGVRRVEVMQPLEDLELKRVETGADATAMFAGDVRVKEAGEGALSCADSSSWTQLAQRLQERKRIAFITQGKRAGLFVPDDDTRLAPPLAAGSDSNSITLSRLPRIGIYTPWSGNMDEGWLRWVFETWKIPYKTIRNEQLRGGNVSDFLDVLIIPDVSASTLSDGRAKGTVHEEFTTGLAPEGSAAIHDFVRGGGTLITFASASKWAIELFDLPLVDVTADARSTTAPSEGFSCPGSVLRSVPQAHELTAALPESLPMMFASSAAWRESPKKDGKDGAAIQPLLRYAKTELLLSGYINKPDTIAGHSAWVRAGIDKGRVHLFAFQPHYRSWAQAGFGLIFRAALLDGQPAEPR